MKALRRLTVRAAFPAELQPLAELVENLRWSWHPESLDLFASVDPELWQACDHDPGRMLGEVSAERVERLAKDRKFLRALADVHDDLTEYLTQPRWYQSSRRPASGCRHRSATSARSSASPRCCRSTPAAWASWPAITSRRPATWACRSSASACCTAPATSASRSRRTAGSSSTTRRWIRAACRSRRSRTPTTSRCASRSRCPKPARCTPRYGWRRSAACRCCCSTATSRRTTPPRGRSPTGSTAAGGSTGWSRSCCSASAASARSVRTAR